MPFLTQSDWEDRKRRFPIHYFFGEICLNTFLAVSRIEFAVLFFCVFLCFFWGCLIRGSRAGENQLKTASCPARGFYGVCLHSAACCAQPHVFVAPCPRAKRSFGARGALIRFIVAVVALVSVESRQSDHSSSSGVAKRSSITRTAAIG